MNVELDEHFPRFTLEDTEHVCLIATYVAAGRSAEINLLPDQQQSWFLSFAQSLSGDSDEAVNAIFSMLQHVLMAQRRDDFTTIQLEPAFSAFARANAVALAKAAKLGALGAGGGVAADFCSGLGGAHPRTDPHDLHWRPGRLSCHRDHDPGARPDHRHSRRVLVFVLRARAQLAIGRGVSHCAGRQWQSFRPARTRSSRIRRRKWIYFDVTRLITPSFQED